MKLMRLAACVAAFAVVGGMVVAEDMDVKALQAKLAAQEARLNDLQAKMYGASCDEGNVADGLTSLRKNATITIGGYVNTRYFYRNGKVKSVYDVDRGTGLIVDTGERGTRAKADAGDLKVADAKLEIKVDVNDHFDAYVKVDLASSNDSASDNAEQYWVRWKNIGNSGFGLIAGRDSFVFGQSPSVGVLDSWTGDGQGAAGDVFGNDFGFGSDLFGGIPGLDGTGEGMFVRGGVIPTHAQWDYSRTTQITPYWENCDGTFKAELSFIQAVNTADGSARSIRDNGSYYRFRSVNYGLGSMSGRVTWKPVEGLTLIASAYNLYQKRQGGSFGQWPAAGGWAANGDLDYETASNSSATQVGFEYTPCFFDKMTVWATWQHGWNDGWVKDMDSDTVNAGVKFDLTEQMYVFAQGDYLRVKNDNAAADVWHKAKGWGAYAGLGYVLPYGVNFEVGYRHDWVDYKDRAGYKHTKYRADTAYAHLGFNF